MRQLRLIEVKKVAKVTKQVNRGARNQIVVLLTSRLKLLILC